MLHLGFLRFLVSWQSTDTHSCSLYYYFYLFIYLFIYLFFGGGGGAEDVKNKHRNLNDPSPLNFQYYCQLSLFFSSVVLPGTIQLSMFAGRPSMSWGGGALNVQGASHHPNQHTWTQWDSKPCPAHLQADVLPLDHSAPSKVTFYFSKI